MKSFLKRSALGAALMSMGLLVACGGGGGSGDGGENNSAVNTLSGVVIDGYIEGAEVCLDLNRNLVCDVNEPKTTTRADGSFSFDTSKLDTQRVQNALLLVNVPITAKDSDDGGRTLAEVQKPRFSMMAPLSAYVTSNGLFNNALVSPLTTLVTHEYLNNKLPLANAKRLVIERLGLPPNFDVLQNFVDKTELQDVHRTAQKLAVALGVAAEEARKTQDISELESVLAAINFVRDNAEALMAVQMATTRSLAADIRALIEATAGQLGQAIEAAKRQTAPIK